MKKEYGDRLARALEFANESAKYHVRNYADGTLMPGDAYADLPIDERPNVSWTGCWSAQHVFQNIPQPKRERDAGAGHDK